MTKVRWEEMFKDEMEAAIARRPVCYLAYGLAEPHGLQNALGLDGLKAQALVELAAQTHGGVVAPMVWWHIHETPLGIAWLARQNAPQPFLTAIPPDIFLHQLLYQLRAVEAAGFRAAICVTGHYGGVEIDMRQLCELYSRSRPLRAVALADWEAIRYKDYHGDHAGMCETSQLAYLRPELVDLTRMPAQPFEGPVFASTDNARQASRSEGEGIVRSQVEYFGKLSSRLLKEAEGQPAGERISWDKTERIWQEFVMDKPHWIGSLEGDSGWPRIAERRKLFPLLDI